MKHQGGGVLGQLSSLFVPKILDESAVAPSLRDAVRERVSDEGIAIYKWYAWLLAGEQRFTAIDCQTSDQSKRFLHLGRWAVEGPEDLAPRLLEEVRAAVRFDEPFGHTTVSRPAPGQSSGPATTAGGWAWDRRVTAVVGTTADGSEVRTPTVNGCWLLVPDPAWTAATGGWRELRAVDARGRMIYNREF